MEWWDEPVTVTTEDGTVYVWCGRCSRPGIPMFHAATEGCPTAEPAAE